MDARAPFFTKRESRKRIDSGTPLSSGVNKNGLPEVSAEFSRIALGCFVISPFSCIAVSDVPRFNRDAYLSRVCSGL